MTPTLYRILGNAVLIVFFGSLIIGGMLEEGAISFVLDAAQSIGLVVAINIAFGLVCMVVGWAWQARHMRAGRGR